MLDPLPVASLNYRFSSQLLLLHPPHYVPAHISNPFRDEEFAWLQRQHQPLGPADALQLIVHNGSVDWTEVVRAVGAFNNLVVIGGLTFDERVSISTHSAASLGLYTAMAMTLDEHFAAPGLDFPFIRAIEGAERFDAISLRPARE